MLSTGNKSFKKRKIQQFNQLYINSDCPITLPKYIYKSITEKHNQQIQLSLELNT